MGKEVCVGVRRVCIAGVCDRRDCCWGVETCWQVRATDDYCVYAASWSSFFHFRFELVLESTAGTDCICSSCIYNTSVFYHVLSDFSDCLEDTL